MFQSLQDALKYLKSKMSNESEKLKVDDEDVLSDALTYFKNPSINIHKPLQVRYRGQPAIDTGGVCRQFFTTVYEQISGADGIHPYLKVMLPSYPYLMHTLQLVRWWQLVKLWHIP